MVGIPRMRGLPWWTTLETPGNSPRFNTYWPAPPDSTVAHSGDRARGKRTSRSRRAPLTARQRSYRLFHKTLFFRFSSFRIDPARGLRNQIFLLKMKRVFTMVHSPGWMAHASCAGFTLVDHPEKTVKFPPL